MEQDVLLRLYALGALDAREAAEAERLVAGSPELLSQLAELRAVAQYIALAPEPIAPRARGKQLLMARVDASLARPHQASPRASAPGLWQTLFGGLAVAAASFAVILGLQLQIVRSEVAQQQAAARASDQSIAALQTQLATLSSQIELANVAAATARDEAASTRRVAGALDADLRLARSEAGTLRALLVDTQTEINAISQPEVRTATISPYKPEYGNAAITVFYSPRSSTALISVANLPPLGPDQTYQVWLIKGERRLPSSIFNTHADGQVRMVVNSDEPFVNYGLFGITIEPAGGRPTPNPDGPIFLGKLA